MTQTLELSNKDFYSNCDKNVPRRANALEMNGKIGNLSKEIEDINKQMEVLELKNIIIGILKTY